LRRANTLDPNRIAVLPEWRDKIISTGATLLDEDFVMYNGIAIGGMGSGLLNPGRVPKYPWIPNFAKNDCYKILLCHQPEYFDRFLRPYDIDLFVSGHAHGGQWRIFGRGVYAPDQPLFPKYTSGLHEDRLIISRGVANSAKPIPRFFNPCEVVIISVKSK
jgi:predicted MPP superfamily phosphohydrolase